MSKLEEGRDEKFTPDIGRLTSTLLKNKAFISKFDPKEMKDIMR
jgi:hypothetical protein